MCQDCFLKRIGIELEFLQGTGKKNGHDVQFWGLELKIKDFRENINNAVTIGQEVFSIYTSAKENWNWLFISAFWSLLFFLSFYSKYMLVSSVFKIGIL